MPWKPIEDPGKDEAAAFLSPMRKRARFLVDQNLGPRVRDFLREKGWNAVDVYDLGLDGQDDEAVFAAAWREDRWLVTNDRDFLDNGRFPFNRNPGLIVLNCDMADGWRLGSCIGYLFWLFGPYPDIYRGAKITISSDGNLSVANIGERPTRYLIQPGGRAMLWTDE